MYHYRLLHLTLSPDLACIFDMPVRLLPAKNAIFTQNLLFQYTLVIHCKNFILKIKSCLYNSLFIYYKKSALQYLVTINNPIISGD